MINELGLPPQSSGLEVYAVKDYEGGHFSLTHAGWLNGKHYFGTVLHIDLKSDGKVWVQQAPSLRSATSWSLQASRRKT